MVVYQVLDVVLESDVFHALGRLSLNLDSVKTCCASALLSIAPDCPCYHVLCDIPFY